MPPLPTPRACIEHDGESASFTGNESWATNFLYPNGWTEHRKVCIRARDPELPIGRGNSFGGPFGLLANCGPIAVLCAAAAALLVLNHVASWEL